MRDDQDLVIRQLFAEQNQDLPANDFMLKLTRRLERQKRARRAYRTFAIIACMALSALVAPWVAQGTSILIGLTAVVFSTVGPHLYQPLTMLMAAATAAGCSPVIYLWRTGRW